MAPLIDMVFLLLIFYIVSTSFVREQVVDLQRPRSALASPVAGHWLPVALTADGQVVVDNRPIAIGDQAAVSAALAASGTRHVVVQVDHRAPTGLLLQVIDTCTAAGAEPVEVAASMPGSQP
jgi:biopolymer transport protein ExbD